jgi:hypothetical protein
VSFAGAFSLKKSHQSSVQLLVWFCREGPSFALSSFWRAKNKKKHEGVPALKLPGDFDKPGCPLSPLIFILAYDPLLSALSALPNLKVFAFADDLAMTAESVEAISPALRIITAFSGLSGLGINRDKSCVISSGPDDSLPGLQEALLGCPWPDLPLRASTTHLGIPIGRDITLGDIFQSPYKKALARLSSAKSVLRGLSVLSRILFINVFIVSLFSYHALFFVIPREFLDVIRSRTHALVTPFSGGAYTYNSLVCLNALFSIRPPLKDLWAFNVSLLAARSPYIRSFANYHSFPTLNIKKSKFISRLLTWRMEL